MLELFAAVAGRCSHRVEWHLWCMEWTPEYYGVVIEIAVDVVDV